MSEPISLILEGIIPPEQHWKYVYLPFDVPENIGRIDVAYSYDAAIGSDPQLSGGNTIDIGIFDARGYQAHSAGYRGWTGSARQSFFIGLDEATPGYMPGPIQAGTWNIILGPYKVAAAGCAYRVEIALTPGPSPSPTGFPSVTGRGGEETSVSDNSEFPALLRVTDTVGKHVHADGWYKGELHCHTFHSDGDSAPEEVVRLAESLGLDFLAITDHNNRSQSISLATCDTDLILIPGYEVTTYYGHWNIWGDNGWIDFRVESAEDLAAFIKEANARGFLVSCNHPRPFGPDWAFPQVEGFSCVEVWNGPWQLMNTNCLAFWENKLRQGERLTAVGGSDHHFTRRQHIARVGQPTTYIYSAESPSSVGLLRALRAGHAFVSESPTGPRLDLRAGVAMMGDEVRRPADGMLLITVNVSSGKGAILQLIGMNELLAQAEVLSDDEHLDLTVNVVSTSYVRAQLIDTANSYVRALTNPIYLS